MRINDEKKLLCGGGHCGLVLLRLDHSIKNKKIKDTWSKVREQPRSVRYLYDSDFLATNNWSVITRSLFGPESEFTSFLFLFSYYLDWRKFLYFYIFYWEPVQITEKKIKKGSSESSSIEPPISFLSFYFYLWRLMHEGFTGTHRLSYSFLLLIHGLVSLSPLYV